MENSLVLVGKAVILKLRISSFWKIVADTVCHEWNYLMQEREKSQDFTWYRIIGDTRQNGDNQPEGKNHDYVGR